MAKKFKVILITGKAGSGKDSLVQMLCENENFYRVVSTTTRPMRSSEKQDGSYHFCSKEEFNGFNMIDPGEFRGWYYGTSIESLDENKYNIIITDPTRIEYFTSNPALDILGTFYLARPDKGRIMGQLSREENPDIKEIFRRYETDERDFKDFMERAGLHILHNDEWNDLIKSVHYIQGLEWLNE